MSAALSQPDPWAVTHREPPPMPTAPAPQHDTEMWSKAAMAAAHTAAGHADEARNVAQNAMGGIHDAMMPFVQQALQAATEAQAHAMETRDLVEVNRQLVQAIGAIATGITALVAVVGAELAKPRRLTVERDKAGLLTGAVSEVESAGPDAIKVEVGRD